MDQNPNQENTLPKSTRPKKFWVISILLFFLILGIGLTYLEFLPYGIAIPGEKVPLADQKYLTEQGYLDEDEKIIYFCSFGFLDAKSEGNYFTDKRVVSYYSETNGQIYFREASYSEIIDIEVSYSDNFIDNTIVTIHSFGNGYFELHVSNVDDYDRDFVDLLMKEWDKKKNNYLIDENVR